MNVPFGLAITELIAETGIPTIAHHHDFYWERQRFMVNAIPDFITMAFPPSLPSIKHVVINSMADKELSYRTGLSPEVIPNILDFETPAPGIDEYNRNVREDLGLTEDDIFILQPTRIVARKGIEHAIEFVHRLNNPRAKLVITHAAGDEGMAYYNRVLSYADLLEVPLIIKPEIIGEKRSVNSDGSRMYTLWDIYPHADMVTYPSIYEGFGNAFLEAIYFRKPILVNRYTIYEMDIEPMGFQVITMNGFVTDDVIQRTVQLLDDEKARNKMVDTNYRLARNFFSFEILRHKLNTIMIHFQGLKKD
jgi:glycosyltransferase involved in cell wall biosynthesis